MSKRPHDVTPSKTLQAHHQLVDSLFDRDAKRLKDAVRHVYVCALVLHQGAQPVGLDHGGSRASLQCEGLLHAAQGELPIALSIRRTKSRELETPQRDGVRRVIQVAEANRLRNAAKP